jgi:hypothetical protein
VPPRLLGNGENVLQPLYVPIRNGSQPKQKAELKKFSLGKKRDVLCLAIMPLQWVVLLLLLTAGALSGCATAQLSPGATLLAGLAEYQGEMQRLGGSTARWPERQRAAVGLKAVITTTVGSSAEFYRLVDLDLRKKEFTVTMRETSVRPDRLKEMNDELAHMNDEIAALKPVIRTQITALSLQSEPERRVEEAATRGLISLALDSFSSNGGMRGMEAPSTKVGQFVVTDMGSFATVRAPDGQTFRCLVFGMAEQGAGIKCDPMK